MIKILADMVDQLNKTSGVDALRKTGTGIDINTILNFVYATAAVVAVGFIVLGGIQFSTAQGEPGKIKQASQTIAFAIIGLVVVMLATVFTNFIFQSV